MSNIVIKIPRNLKGWLSNINEVYTYKTHARKDLLCPIILQDPFRLFVVMKRAKPLYQFTDEENLLIENVFLKDEILLNDIKENNFGRLNGKMIKVDYGRDFWLYNFLIDIKSKFKNN